MNLNLTASSGHKARDHLIKARVIWFDLALGADHVFRKLNVLGVGLDLSPAIRMTHLVTYTFQAKIT